MMRFAPSPTGRIHIGNARTALLNYITAISRDLEFIIRIDDTDTSRNKIAADSHIFTDLNWLGIRWSQVVYQSSRLDVYSQALKSMSGVESVDGCDVIFVKQPTIQWTDMNFGEQCTKLPPHILLTRQGGMPLFNFCSIVDDLDLNTSMILTGSDHITNTGTQVYIKNLIDPERVINFLHLPMIVDAAGAPMSKRNKETSFDHLRESGIDANTVVNYIMSLSSEHMHVYTNIGQYSESDIRYSTSPVCFDVSKLHDIQNKLIKRYDYNDIRDRLSLQTSADKWQTIACNTSDWVQVAYWEGVFNSDDLSFMDSKNDYPADYPAITNNTADAFYAICQDPTLWEERVAHAKCMKFFRYALTGMYKGPPIKSVLSCLSPSQITHRLRFALEHRNVM